MENPLQNYYRHKDIYVKLPTGGKWMKETPNLTADGEIGVRAMTVRDELLLNIPDALYNGQAIYELIESICPDIGDASDMSLPDVDVIMLASRATSYEKTFPVEATCSHCDTAQMFEVDLQQVLGKVKSVWEQTEIEVDGLVVEMRPNTVSAIHASNIKVSETSRVLASMTDTEEVNEQLKQKYSENIQQIAAANIVLLADAIVKVTMPDGKQVTDTQHIIDWLTNSNRKVNDVLTKQRLRMNLNGIEKSFTFTCAEETCGKDFSAEIEFNPSFFFTSNSAFGKTLNK